MKHILVPTLTIAALALAGLTLTSATPPASAAAVSAPAASGSYTVDPVHSTVIFSTTHMNTSRSYGRFNAISGTFAVDMAKPEASKVEIQIDVNSIDTANKDRDAHLLGPDFFDAKQFPVATFQSTSVKKSGEKTWSVTGTLALHCVKKEVTIPLEMTGTGKGREGEALIGFHGTFSIQRADYGIQYGKGMLGDKVDLIVSVEAAAK
ncbi:MAG: YceI family protein [Planctomycetota bacterium]|nr:YceI family protein [Planctomycetota bacterium]